MRKKYDILNKIKQEKELTKSEQPQEQAEQKHETKPEGKAQSKPEQAEPLQAQAHPAAVEQKAQPQPQPHKQKQWHRQGQAQAQDTLKGFVGKDVVLSGGAKMKGRLESVAQYDLVITTSYKPVIVLKHAVERAGA